MTLAYHELPRHGLITLKTGEVLEYRAKDVKQLENGIYVIEDAYFIDHKGEINGPFTLQMHPAKPTEITEKGTLHKVKWGKPEAEK